MVDGLHRVGLRRLALGLVIVRHALLEGLDALGEVTHQVGNLAASTEQQQADGKDNDPVPNAHRTHVLILRGEGAARAHRATRALGYWDRLKLGVERAKNK